MTNAMLLGYGLALYVAVGAVISLAFVTIGVRRVMAPPNVASPLSFTIGARLLILPGVVALWPYVLARWLKAGNPQ